MSTPTGHGSSGGGGAGGGGDHGGGTPRRRGGGRRGAASNPVNFYVGLQLDDRLSEGFTQVVEALQGIARQIEGVGHQVEHQTEHSTQGVLAALEHAGHAAHQFEAIGHRGLGMIERLTETVTHAASEFDNLRGEMNFAFGADADRAFNNLRQFEQNSSYSMAELTGSVAALRSAFREIDPTDLTPRFLSTTGRMQNGLEALSDAAAGTQQSLGNVIQEVERALEGNMMSLQYQMRLSNQEVTSIRQNVARATTQQERYNAIVGGLAHHWGGAQNAMANTFGMLNTRLRSMSHLLLATIGRAGLEPLKQAMREIHTAMVGLLTNERAIEALSGMFHMVTSMALSLVRVLIRIGQWFVNFAANHPTLLKAFAAIFTAVSAAMVAIGALFAGLAGIAGIITSVAAAAPVLIATLHMLVMVIGQIIVAGGSVIRIVGLLWWAIRYNFAGIGNIFRALGTLISGFVQAIRNMHGETTEITDETARALEQAGVYDWFRDVVTWIFRAHEFLSAFWDEMTRGFSTVMPPFRAAWVEIERAVRMVLEAVGQALTPLVNIGPATSVSMGKAHNAGVSLAQLFTRTIVPVLRATAWVIAQIARAVQFVAPAIGRVASVIRGVGRALHWMWDAARTAWNWIKRVTLGVGHWIAGVGRGFVMVAERFNILKPVLGAIRSLFSSIAGFVAQIVEGIRHMELPSWVRSLGGFAGRAMSWVGRHLFGGGAPNDPNLTMDDALTERVSRRRYQEKQNALPGLPANASPQQRRRYEELVRTARAESAASDPLGGGEASSIGGDRRSAEERHTQLVQQLRELVAQTRQQTQLMQSGALTPQIEGESIAGAVRTANASRSERLGQQARGRAHR